MIERSRKEVMQHMLKENVGLILSRQLDKSGILPAFITYQIIDAHSITSAVSISYLFPLYLYYEQKQKKSNPLMQMMIFEPESKYHSKQPNIKQQLFEELSKSFKKEVTPEEIFYYIYAVLYSNIYRTKYAEFLKIDFPRIPFTKNYKLFIQLAKLGKQLADLHLLKSEELEKTSLKFPIEGNIKVEKPRFDSAQRDNGKVWINKKQFFDGVRKEVWQYQIGGYQVCEKWLKDRKDIILSLDDIKTYSKIVMALSKTIALQKEIDKYFSKVENHL
jgi:predicted helicase